MEDHQYMEWFLFSRNEDYMRVSEERLKAGAAKLCEERFTRDGRCTNCQPPQPFVAFLKQEIKNDE